MDREATETKPEDRAGYISIQNNMKIEERQQEATQKTDESTLLDLADQ